MFDGICKINVRSKFRERSEWKSPTATSEHAIEMNGGPRGVNQRERKRVRTCVIKPTIKLNRRAGEIIFRYESCGNTKLDAVAPMWVWEAGALSLSLEIRYFDCDTSATC